jgi:hypothetical protein
MLTGSGPRALWFALFLLMAAGCYMGMIGSAAAAAQCPDNNDKGQSWRADCTKEVRIVNNTPGTIYVILQASKQGFPALKCPVGDLWLQNALGKFNQCFPVKNDYYVFINPGPGLAKGETLSINVPFWSKRATGAADTYVDWWRGARVFIFDDKVALNDAFAKLQGKPQVAFDGNSPRVVCKAGFPDNACRGIATWEVTADAALGAQTPYQLNEFTFGNANPLKDNNTAGGEWTAFNQNYNVSNVDQVYLPIAIEPIRDPADIGYMGTTMTVGDFRKKLAAFAFGKENPNPATDKLVWPIYNNPKVGGSRLYPDAGIRVPGANPVFAFYEDNPGTFKPPVPPDTPIILPKDPPKLIKDMMTQWANCTKPNPLFCPQSKMYKAVNEAFLDNYANYVATCNNIPAWLKPLNGVTPLQPKLEAFLAFVYGWVEFNVGCGNKPLPTVDDAPAGSRVPIDYKIALQYNWENGQLTKNQWFNPYVQLVHDDRKSGGLNANAYAFSIDDESAFLSNSGEGLIFAVGGKAGLPNGTQVPPPLPAVYYWFDFQLSLAGPNPVLGETETWEKFGICSETADKPFPGKAMSENGGYAIGMDPAALKISLNHACTVTLKDSKNRIYKLQILKANVPPAKIWPDFKPSTNKGFDPNVLACPSEAGVVGPEKWCQFIQEQAVPGNYPTKPNYSLSTRAPLK